MASVCFCLALLSTLMWTAESTGTTPVARNSYEEYTLPGGPQSFLFSGCLEKYSIRGSLYSIAVSVDEEYVLFEPDQTYEMAWIDLDLGSPSSILDCAQSAFELGALMFKHKGMSCSVTMNDTYNPSRKQGCGSANSEIVYISSRVSEMSFFGDIFLGESANSFGCVNKNGNGWKYGMEDGREVDEDSLPTRDTCCTSAAAEYCLVAECSAEPMSYCEAEARCRARGLLPAPRSFNDTFDGVDLALLGTDESNFWVDVYQVQEDGFARMTNVDSIPPGPASTDGSARNDGNTTTAFTTTPGSESTGGYTGNDETTTTASTTTPGSESTGGYTGNDETTTTAFTTTSWSASINRYTGNYGAANDALIPISGNCAVVGFTKAPRRVKYTRTQCTGAKVKCILCYDPNRRLPAC